MYQRIYDLCVKKGISVPALEAKIGLGNGTISKWKESSPSVDNLKKVANFFGVSLDYLVGIGDKKK